MTKRLLIVLLSSLSVGAYSAASIAPGVFFLSEKVPSIRLTVKNKSTHKAYIKMESILNDCKPVGLLECDASQLQKNSEITEDLLEHLRFSKPRFILAPEQQKVIFLSWKGKFPDHPAAFNIYADDLSPKDIAVSNGQTTDGKIKMQFNVKVKYLSTLLVLPKGAQYKSPNISKQNNELVLKNPGTSQIYLYANQECSITKGCISYRNTLLPKQTVKLPITQPGKIIVTYLNMSDPSLKYTTVDIP